MFNLGAMLGHSVIYRNVTISSSAEEWNLINTVFGGVAPTKRAIINITVNAGIHLSANSNAVAAMDLTGLPAGSQIVLLNFGNITGAGGNGGAGAFYASITDVGCSLFGALAAAGQSGGASIEYDGTGVDLEIQNSGTIYAGGGGGGGGGRCHNAGTCTGNAGGGGGGGVGGGTGVGEPGTGGAGGTATKDGVPITNGAGTVGGTGGRWSAGAPGSGGAAGTNAACGTAGAGGAGGSFGVAGSAGSGSSPGAGGAGGKAVSNLGTGTTTVTSGGASIKGTVE